MVKSYEEKREYNRGYQRGCDRRYRQAANALKLAQLYRARLADTSEQLCGGCARWERGGDSCKWGYCDNNFSAGAGEGNMWVDVPTGIKQPAIITHDNFGCVNWLPKLSA